MFEKYDGDTEQPRDKDARVALMERLVGLEDAQRLAQANAKEAAAKASKIGTELANVKNELNKMLGVVSEDEARAIRVEADR